MDGGRAGRTGRTGAGQGRRSGRGAARGHGRGIGGGPARGRDGGRGACRRAGSTEPCTKSAAAPGAAAVDPAAERADATSQVSPVERSRTVAVVVRADACTQCELCLDSCSHGAIRLLEAPVIDEQTCSGCGACVNACPNRVLDLAGA